MAKASDLLKKFGASPAPLAGGAKHAIPLAPKKPEEGAKPDSADHVTAQKPDRGHSLHKPGKAQGGAGAPGGRPKV
ncbi:MAG TPA: hypothetical protein PL072_02625 [Phycisphaerales bacterium]|nr:hypothetical protein [Phycisphaerales bacterium]